MGKYQASSRDHDLAIALEKTCVNLGKAQYQTDNSILRINTPKSLAQIYIFFWTPS
jgi:hypothetical protein